MPVAVLWSRQWVFLVLVAIVTFINRWRNYHSTFDNRPVFFPLKWNTEGIKVTSVYDMCTISYEMKKKQYRHYGCLSAGKRKRPTYETIRARRQHGGLRITCAPLSSLPLVVAVALFKVELFSTLSRRWTRPHLVTDARRYSCRQRSSALIEHEWSLVAVSRRTCDHSFRLRMSVLHVNRQNTDPCCPFPCVLNCTLLTCTHFQSVFLHKS